LGKRSWDNVLPLTPIRLAHVCEWGVGREFGHRMVGVLGLGQRMTCDSRMGLALPNCFIQFSWHKLDYLMLRKQPFFAQSPLADKKRF